MTTKEEIEELRRKKHSAWINYKAHQSRYLNAVYAEVRQSFPQVQNIDEFIWECNTSPTGECIYDRDVDPTHSNCLYCHKPEKRD